MMRLFLILLLLTSSCSKEDERLLLSLQGPGLEETEQLILYLSDEEGRQVGERVDLKAAGLSLGREAIILELRIPEALPEEILLYVAACRGGAECHPDSTLGPKCSCPGGALAFAAKEQKSGLIELLLEPQADCDRDEDSFPACDRGCCETIPSSLWLRVGDCDDRDVILEGGSYKSAEARPFRPFEWSREEAESRGSEALRRHKLWCGDGLDNDCHEGDRPCLFEDQDRDGDPQGLDCDDQVPHRFHGNQEICGDGVDQDCDGLELPCDTDGDGVFSDRDCDDLDPRRFPGNLEICGDEIDQDCSGDDLRCLPQDLDGDQFPCPFEEPWDSHRCFAEGLDCDDLDNSIYPGALERCGDEIDQDCDGLDLPCPSEDQDGDGYRSLNWGGGDCDDQDPLRFPGAAERCDDGIDQDCNGEDPSCRGDEDGDRWLPPGDCDDEEAGVYPGAEEFCNGRDDDCDQLIDEGNPLCSVLGECQENPCGDFCIGEQPCACREAPWLCYQERDQETGVPISSASLSCLGISRGELPEICNGLDDDCNGELDEEGSQPLRISCYSGSEESRDQGICHGGQQFCNAVLGSGEASWGACEDQVLPREELCNNLDERAESSPGVALLRGT